MGQEARTELSVTVSVETPGLDETLEKANRLVELLREASNIIDSLARGQG